ncbi:unnamed protein product [Cercospora beticola]|nr:unnamed protein product [Cercospora beticola]
MYNNAIHSHPAQWAACIPPARHSLSVYVSVHCCVATVHMAVHRRSCLSSTIPRPACIWQCDGRSGADSFGSRPATDAHLSPPRGSRKQRWQRRLFELPAACAAKAGEHRVDHYFPRKLRSIPTKTFRVLPKGPSSPSATCRPLRDPPHPAPAPPAR